jgi:CHASE2 domain-containing sensor protein
MTEKESHAANGEPETLQDWPTLVTRAVDDVSRILQSEVHLLQTSMGAALARQLANAIATLTMIAVMICGAVCIVCAAILLLHEWIPLWQAFAIAGVAILLIAIAIHAIMRPPAGFKSAES